MFLIWSYCTSDTVHNKTSITSEDLELLYVLQESEVEAVLITIDGFGVTGASSGSYSCLATNNLTQAAIAATVDVLGNFLRKLLDYVDVIPRCRLHLCYDLSNY